MRHFLLIAVGIALICVFKLDHSHASETDVEYGVSPTGEIIIKDGPQECNGYATGAYVIPGIDEVYVTDRLISTELDNVCGIVKQVKQPYKLCRQSDGSYQDWRFHREPQDSHLPYSLIAVAITVAPESIVTMSTLCGCGSITGNVIIASTTRYLNDCLNNQIFDFVIKGPPMVPTDPPDDGGGDPARSYLAFNIYGTTFGTKVNIDVDEGFPYETETPGSIGDSIFEGKFEANIGQAMIVVHNSTFAGDVKLSNNPITKRKFSKSLIKKVKSQTISKLTELKKKYVKSEDYYDDLIALVQKISAPNPILINETDFAHDLDVESHGAWLGMIHNWGPIAAKLSIRGGSVITGASFDNFPADENPADIKIRCDYFRAEQDSVLLGNLMLGDDFEKKTQANDCKEIVLEDSVVHFPARIEGSVRANQSWVKGNTALLGDIYVQSSEIGLSEEENTENLALSITGSPNVNASTIAKSKVKSGTYVGVLNLGVYPGDEFSELMTFEKNDVEGSINLKSPLSNSKIRTVLPPSTGPIAEIVKIGEGTVIGADSEFNGNVEIGDHARIGANAYIENSNIVGTNVEIGDRAILEGATLSNYVAIRDDVTLLNSNLYSVSNQLLEVHDDSSIAESTLVGPGTIYEEAAWHNVSAGYSFSVQRGSSITNTAISSLVTIGANAVIDQSTIGSQTSVGDEVSINKASFYISSIGDVVVIDGQGSMVSVTNGTIADGCQAKGNITLMSDGKILNGATLQSTTGASQIMNNGVLTGADVTGRLILNGVSFSTSGFHEKYCYIDSENEYQCDEL